MPGRLRGLGYKGRIIFEAQGLGTREQALDTIKMAIPYLRAHCDAAVLPPTDHLLDMFIHICPWLHRFVIPNMLDTDHFAPLAVDTPPYPVLAWVGRLEHNKTGVSSSKFPRRLLKETQSQTHGSSMIPPWLIRKMKSCSGICSPSTGYKIASVSL